MLKFNDIAELFWFGKRVTRYSYGQGVPVVQEGVCLSLQGRGDGPTEGNVIKVEVVSGLCSQSSIT